MNFSAIRGVVFDFDGVLADTFPELLGLFEQVCAQQGRPVPSRAEIEELRSLGVREVLDRLEIPMRRLPALIRSARRELAARAGRLQTFPGMDEAVRKLVEQGFTLGIVTSNSRETVEHFLRARDWTPLFSSYETGSSLFGKNRLISRWLKREDIPAEHAAYVGDECRDIEAARKSGVIPIAAGWGYAAEAALRRENPAALLSTPSELPKVFKSFSGESQAISRAKPPS